MNKDIFERNSFEKNEIEIRIDNKPVSLQANNKTKKEFKNEVRKITSFSEHIITGTCFVHIDFYCNNLYRHKNPGAYDIDNIIKPILDSISGLDGLLIDDSIVDRVCVNWIDTHKPYHIKINIHYPLGFCYEAKSNLVIIKSPNNWCLPSSKDAVNIKSYTSLIKSYFRVWESIKTENDYNTNMKSLPVQMFLHFNKIKDKNHPIIDLADL